MDALVCNWKTFKYADDNGKGVCRKAEDFGGDEDFEEGRRRLCEFAEWATKKPTMPGIYTVLMIAQMAEKNDWENLTKMDVLTKKYLDDLLATMLGSLFGGGQRESEQERLLAALLSRLGKKKKDVSSSNV